MKAGLTRGVLQELHDDALADERSLAVLAEDCVRLLRTAPVDYRLVKEESWYARIWSSVGGKRLEGIGAGCAQVGHAQGLAVELLRALANKHPRGQLLVELVAEDLERLISRQGPFTGRLATLTGEIVALRRQLRQGSTNSVDERALPEELRVLILRGMIAAAWADGAIQGAEIEIITRKAAALDLSAEARRLIEAELHAPSPLDRDLARVESLSVKRLLYRNVAAVVMADGAIQTREAMFLARVARALGLPRAATEAINEELYGVISVLGLDVLVAAVVRRRAAVESRAAGAGAGGAPATPATATPAPATLSAAELAAAAQATAAQPAAAPLVDPSSSAAASAPAVTLDPGLVEQLAESWLALLARLVAAGCEAIQAPLHARLHEYLDAADADARRALMDVVAIGAERREHANDLLDRLDRELDRCVGAYLPALPEPSQALWSPERGRAVRAVVDHELDAGLVALQRLPGLDLQVAASAGAGVDGGDTFEVPGLGMDLQAALDELDASVGRIYDHVMTAAGVHFDDALVPALVARDADAELLESFRGALLEAEEAAAGLAEARDDGAP